MKNWKWMASASLMATIGLSFTTWNHQNTHLVMAQQSGGGIVASDCSVALIKVAALASDRPGILDFMEVTEGDEVRANQKVAGLKDGVARAALKTATDKAANDVQVRYALKATEFAEVELRIAQDANSRVPGSVPKLEIEKLSLGVQRGRLQGEQAVFEQAVAKSTQEEAEEQLKTYEVIAPFDGKVSKVLLKKGMAVRQGDPILEIVNTELFKVEGYLSVADSYKVKEGDDVVLQITFRDSKQGVQQVVNTPFHGKVKYVDPRVEITSRVKVLAYVENVDGLLKEGLRGTMHIKSAPANPFRAERTR